MTASVVPMVIETLEAVIHKLGEWLLQIPETTLESVDLGTATILRRTLKLTGLW